MFSCMFKIKGQVTYVHACHWFHQYDPMSRCIISYLGRGEVVSCGIEATSDDIHCQLP